MKGMKNRLSRILNPKTGRGLIIAIDHGMALGAMTGIAKPAAVFETLDPHADAWLMTKGIFTYVYEPCGNKGIILRASGGATIAGPDITREGPTASVEELLSLSADAVAASAYIGSSNEHETLRYMSKVAESCRRWQVPLVGVIGVGKDKEKAQDPKFIALGARVAAEPVSNSHHRKGCSRSGGGHGRGSSACPNRLRRSGGITGRCTQSAHSSERNKKGDSFEIKLSWIDRCDGSGCWRDCTGSQLLRFPQRG